MPLKSWALLFRKLKFCGSCLAMLAAFASRNDFSPAKKGVLGEETVIHCLTEIESRFELWSLITFLGCQPCPLLAFRLLSFYLRPAQIPHLQDVFRTLALLNIHTPGYRPDLGKRWCPIPHTSHQIPTRGGVGRKIGERRLRSCQFDHHQDNQELLKLQAEGLQVELSHLDLIYERNRKTVEKVTNPEIFGGMDIKSTQKGCHRFERIYVFYKSSFGQYLLGSPPTLLQCQIKVSQGFPTKIM